MNREEYYARQWAGRAREFLTWRLAVSDIWLSARVPRDNYRAHWPKINDKYHVILGQLMLVQHEDFSTVCGSYYAAWNNISTWARENAGLLKERGCEHNLSNWPVRKPSYTDEDWLDD